MQRNCTFPGRYAPLTYYEDVLIVQFDMRDARVCRASFVTFFSRERYCMLTYPIVSENLYSIVIICTLKNFQSEFTYTVYTAACYISPPNNATNQSTLSL